jgi:hypothetical protein
MNLVEMRTRVRQDLHDEDPNNYRWTDAELDRHIDRAVRELSLAAPLEAKAALTSSAGSRDVTLVSLIGLVSIEAVEYPVGRYPPCYVPFSRWESTLTLLVDGVPSGGENVYVFYTTLHTLDASSSTIPAHLEELVALGAEAYAALEWASYATNRVNVGGSDTWRHYLVWGQERLAAFSRGLAQQSRKNAVRVRRLYRPVEPAASQTTDWGP